MGPLEEGGPRRAWDPTHQSAQAERQVKIRACLDLATVLNTVPSAYRGVLSDAFARFTEKIDSRDQLTRAKSKLERLRLAKEVPHTSNSLKLPTVQFQKGSRDLWNELWSLPAESKLKKFKLELMDDEINFHTAQLLRLEKAMDSRELVKDTWNALFALYEARPKFTTYKVNAFGEATDAGGWPVDTPTLEVSNVDFLKNELQALQVDLPVYFRKVYDLKMDTIERIHGKGKKKAEEKQKVDVEMEDIASSSTKEAQEAVNQLVQKQIAAAFKARGIPAPSPSKKVRGVRVSGYHQNPTHSFPAGRQRQAEASPEARTYTQGEKEGEEGCQEGRLSTLGEGTGDGPQTPASYRRRRSQEE